MILCNRHLESGHKNPDLTNLDLFLITAAYQILRYFRCVFEVDPRDSKTEYLSVLYKILRKEVVEGLPSKTSPTTRYMFDNKNTVYTYVSSHQPTGIPR